MSHFATPLTGTLPDSVYPPSEDTYILLDTLSSLSEIAFLSTRFCSGSTPLVLELGPGSGTVVSFLTTNCREIFGRDDVVTVAIDANPAACMATIETVGMNQKKGVFGGAITGDLTSVVKDNVVDVLLFNPPYVPSEDVPPLLLEGQGEDEQQRKERLLRLTYDGGVDGMEVTNRVLEALGNVLSIRGVAYVVLCRQNHPEEVEARMAGRGWEVEKVGCSGRKGGMEKLGVWRIWKDENVEV